jgi:hypothetical protein
MYKTVRASGSRWIIIGLVASAGLWPWFFALPPADVASAGTTPETVANKLPISLMQSVLLALQNNMDIKVERLSPLIRKEEVRVP